MDVNLLNLIRQSDKIVGTKQVLKSIVDGTVRCVIVSDDADGGIISCVTETAAAKGVKVYHSETMVELGRACGIEVGAAAAALK